MMLIRHVVNSDSLKSLIISLLLICITAPLLFCVDFLLQIIITIVGTLGVFGFIIAIILSAFGLLGSVKYVFTVKEEWYYEKADD